MMTAENPSITATAGALTLLVWYIDDRPDESGGIRRGYGYRIADDDPAHEPAEGDDLESGVGADIDVHHALGTLVSFLSAAADTYRLQMSDPNAVTELVGSFPAWMGEAAYLNDSELSVLAWENEEGAAVPEVLRHSFTDADVDAAISASTRPAGPSTPSL